MGEGVPNERGCDEGEVSLPRRKFLSQALGLAAGALVPGAMSESWAQESGSEFAERYPEGWFFSMEDIEKIYEQEYGGEKKLQNVIRYEGGVLRGRSFREDIVIPHNFIEQICAHCSDMLAAGTATRLFRLDAFHNHLYLPHDVVERSHTGLSIQAAIDQSVRDTRLVALYHNSEHLRIPEEGTPLFELYKKRNVVGFFDGKPIEVLPLPQGKRTAADLSLQTVNPDVKFAAHKNGLFSISHRGETIRLDISLDDRHYY